MSLINHLRGNFVEMLGEGKMLKLLAKMRFGDFLRISCPLLG